ncbi:MAG: precorrin-3B C(17)-methyltransferase, partial [Deltaproteobacteria bacterium]|nr:precorrin-3B C(17)-methyltransferase [Deltaproteobacteria bacterium]
MRSGSPSRGPDGPPPGPQAQEQQSHLRPGPHELLVVGLGSRGPQGLTLEARDALGRAEAVFGYRLYLEQAEPFLREGAAVSPSGMTAETRRAREALELAMTGKVCALVSGGDAGVYAMAGVAYEVAAELSLPLGTGPGELRITVVPGTPALCAGAALLGAPLTHDFCCVSLSDRLTEWEDIKKRLEAASSAGFVIVIYNPRSHGRDWQLG